MDYNEVFEYRDGKLFSKITERILIIKEKIMSITKIVKEETLASINEGLKEFELEDLLTVLKAVEECADSLPKGE